MGDYSVDLFIWSIGTGVWSLVLLQRLDAVRTVLAMPLGMRIQTSAGVGLVTAMALLLSKEEFTAIGTVWGWTATIALAALLLSGLGRGVLNSSKQAFGLRAIKEQGPRIRSDKYNIDSRPVFASYICGNQTNAQEASRLKLGRLRGLGREAVEALSGA